MCANLQSCDYAPSHGARTMPDEMPDAHPDFVAKHFLLPELVERVGAAWCVELVESTIR